MNRKFAIIIIGDFMFEFIIQHLSEISNFAMAIATVIMAFYTIKLYLATQINK